MNWYSAARFVALASTIVAVSAHADDSFFDSMAKKTGLMAEPTEPADFVKASRPKTESTSMPLFADPEEPRSKVKSAAELKAMDADLERASARQRLRTSSQTKSTIQAKTHVK